jgi:hypothetical protein
MLLSLSEGRWRREERQRDNQPDERLKRGRKTLDWGEEGQDKR